MLGQPQDCDAVEVAQVPGALLGELWELQRGERRRVNRVNATKEKRRFITHECGGNCGHTGSWNKRVRASLEEEKKTNLGQVGLVEVNQSGREVNSVPVSDDQNEIVVVTLDSGAYNTVGPPKVGTRFPVQPTNASKEGRHYRAANGSVIKNYGQRVITGKNEHGKQVGLPIQVADVNKVLGSAREMLESGNRVVMDRGAQGRSCSYIEHKATGRKTAVHERNGAYQFNIAIPKGKGEEVSVVQQRESVQGFPRQGTLEADLFY